MWYLSTQVYLSISSSILTSLRLRLFLKSQNLCCGNVLVKPSASWSAVKINRTWSSFFMGPGQTDARRNVFTEPRWHYTGSGTYWPDAASLCAFPSNTWAWDRPTKTSMVSEWALKCAGGGVRSGAEPEPLASTGAAKDAGRLAEAVGRTENICFSIWTALLRQPPLLLVYICASMV
jgi:hypothetical protein